MNLLEALRARIAKNIQNFREPRFFHNALWSSRYFRTNTIEMFIALTTGMYALIQWWDVLPDMVIIAIVCALTISVGGWISTILAHKTIRMHLTQSREQSGLDPWSLASQQVQSHLYSANGIAILLLWAILFLLAHYARPSWWTR